MVLALDAVSRIRLPVEEDPTRDELRPIHETVIRNVERAWGREVPDMVRSLIAADVGALDPAEFQNGAHYKAAAIKKATPTIDAWRDAGFPG